MYRVYALHDGTWLACWRTKTGWRRWLAKTQLEARARCVKAGRTENREKVRATQVKVFVAVQRPTEWVQIAGPKE